MLPHQERVVAEKVALDEKIVALGAFIGVPNATYVSLETVEKERLGRQYSAMTEYSEVLGERIAAF